MIDVRQAPFGLVRTMRPRQWLKNALVFGAPAAAGVLTRARALEDSGWAFVAFCLAASGTYCINDVMDREKDRLHPTKCNRPVASGQIAASTAVAAGVALLALGLGVGATIGRPKLVLVVGVYVAVTVAYSLWLKHQPLIELGLLASGFVLRAIAGGTAANVPLSNWFLIVACFGSLFVVAGKREAEVMLLGAGGSAHRQALGEYSPTFLRYVRSVSSAVLMMAYCEWAFENPGLHHDVHSVGSSIWFQLSIAPFVLGVLRYAMLIDAGKGGAPEDVFIRDRTLQFLGLCMMILFAAGVYR